MVGVVVVVVMLLFSSFVVAAIGLMLVDVGCDRIPGVRLFKTLLHYTLQLVYYGPLV